MATCKQNCSVESIKCFLDSSDDISELFKIIVLSDKPKDKQQIKQCFKNAILNKQYQNIAIKRLDNLFVSCCVSQR